MTEFQVAPGEQGKPEISVVEHDHAAAWGSDTTFSVVGQPVRRLEGWEKVSGHAKYTSDIRLPGQLFARVLRSPHPHARIARIDVSAAEALPGVYAVLCAANTDPVPWYETSFVFDTTVRLAGDEVAAVAAETEDIAGDAIRLIEVEWELLPHVTDLDAALEPGAPPVWPGGNITEEPTIYDRGDAERGLREADVIVDQKYRTAAALHNSLEPHGCTAWWEGDRLTLWDSTQSVFTVREEVAEALKLPLHRVRVIKEHMGGGFGAKQISWKQDVIASLLSRAAGRPVQLILDREAENLAVGNRNATRQRVRLGARSDGTLTAIWADIVQARGAYLTGGEASNVSGMYQTLYQCPNVHTRQTAVYINAGPAVAFRAPGHVEAAFALEQAMDELALALDLDPIALRRKNYATIDQQKDLPYTLPDALEACYQRVSEGSGWHERSSRSASHGSKVRATTEGRPYGTGMSRQARNADRYAAGMTEGPRRRGIGFAAHDWMGGSGHPPGYAWIELNSDGSADVVTGTQDIGTGTRTGLAQVAAEELGLPIDRIAFHLGDTALGPYAPVSSGSATQATIGPAIRDAAAQVKATLLDLASQLLEIPVDRLDVRDGTVRVDGDAAHGMPVADIMEQVAPNTIRVQGARSPNPEHKSVRTCGAQVVELEVDTGTGEVTVLQVVTAHDIGRIVNPATTDSQVIGGIVQGLGFALTEERVIDHSLGVVLNPNLEEYKVPTVADAPPVQHIHLDLPDNEANSTGAKGVGEPPLVPTAPAVANAIFDAIGLRLRSGPFTREQVLAHLTEREAPA